MTTPSPSDYETLWCMSFCGYTWQMDYEPDPGCGCDVYKLGFEYEDGSVVWDEWRDSDGNVVTG